VYVKKYSNICNINQLKTKQMNNIRTEAHEQALKNLIEWLENNKDLRGSEYYISREQEAQTLYEIVHNL
jgi:hypothetical protein